MMRLPRLVSSITLACCLAAPSLPRFALADDATGTPGAAVPTPAAGGDNNMPAPTTPPAAGDAAATPAAPADTTAAPADNTTGELPPAAAPTLVDQVDTFWHYGKMGDYALAADAGRKILASGSDARTVLEAFETVTSRKNDSMDVWLLRWRSLPVPDTGDRAAVQQMRDVSDKLTNEINEGFATRASDPNYIRQTLFEMSNSARAYDNNLPRISKSGEVAVKVIIDILRTPDERQYFNTCRRVLRDLGRKALNPLLAATEMKDYSTLVEVVTALGDIGYDASVPYLSRLARNPNLPEAIRTSASNALYRIGAGDPNSMRPADQFFNLAEKCYYGRSDLAPASDKISYIWYWSSENGLVRKEVPTPIFNDLLAMRAAEYAMRLDASMGRAVSLWLDANTKREVDLPAGAIDLTHQGDPDANYYNTSAGVKYLGDALARALHDRNASVAYKLCESMQNIIGQNNLDTRTGNPLTQRFFPNRQVRYEAAFALASSLPTKSFSGSDRVVPLLVEAMSQTDKPGILVVAPAGNSTTAGASDIRDAIQTLGYPVVAVNRPVDAAGSAASLPTIDLIVISEDSDVPAMIQVEKSIARLQGVPMLVLTHSGQSPFSVQAATDTLLSTAMLPPKSSLAAELKDDIDNARVRSGTAVLADADATAYALQAAALLQKLAITRGHALDVSVAEGGLLTSLSHKRPKIAMAAGQVLGTLNSPTAQNGLAMKANDETTPGDVRVSLYESLADSAKHQGNHLDSPQISDLEKVVSGSKDAKVRDAAAEVRGALDLPADQARTLIIKQSRT